MVPEDAAAGVGERADRMDAAAKTLGTGEYVDDMQVPDMLHAAVLRAPVPRARILAINIDMAQKLDGVEAVMTAADIPGQRFWGHLKRDWPALIAVGKKPDTSVMLWRSSQHGQKK